MLSVQNLEYYYGRIHALRGVSFEIKEGDLCIIIGSNGAGKSTLMSSLIGMLDATGDIYLNGEKLGREKPYARINRGMVLVPEGRRIFPNLTVTENLMMGGYTAKNREEGIQRAFKMFPVLEERKKQRAGTLSGGEQQMLAIGRGLMANPRLLLLDEPSLGLAPIIVNSVMQTIKRINEQGITILLVEQNACDRQQSMCARTRENHSNGDGTGTAERFEDHRSLSWWNKEHLKIAWVRQRMLELSGLG